MCLCFALSCFVLCYFYLAHLRARRAFDLGFPANALYDSMVAAQIARVRRPAPPRFPPAMYMQGVAHPLPGSAFFPSHLLIISCTG